MSRTAEQINTIRCTTQAEYDETKSWAQVRYAGDPVCEVVYDDVLKTVTVTVPIHAWEPPV